MENMPVDLPTKDAVVRILANAHYVLEEGITDIYRIHSRLDEDDPREPIKLLEVNRSAVPVGIMPVHFGVGKNIPYPSIIMDVTPEEFDDLRYQRLSLPKDWTLGAKLPRQDRN